VCVSVRVCVCVCVCVSERVGEECLMEIFCDEVVFHRRE
jgi:hypothetical protein